MAMVFLDIIEEFDPDWWGVYVAYYDKNQNVIFKQKKEVEETLLFAENHY